MAHSLLCRGDTDIILVMWLTFFPNFDQDGVLCQGSGRPDNLVANNFKHAFAILRLLQERLILARSFGKRLRKLFVDLLECKSQYNNPDSPTEMKVSHGLKKYLEMENDHKEFGDEVTETDNVAFEEAPNLQVIVDEYWKENSTDSSHYSPNATKSEVKNEIGTPVERAPESRSAPAVSPSFTSVNKGYSVPNHTSTSHQHYPSSYQQPYQSADRSSSIRAAPDPQQYGATYSHPAVSAESIAPNAVDHRPSHPGGVAPVNNFLEYYPNLPYNGDYTQGQFMMTDVGDVWTGNTSVPVMEDYPAQQQSYWPSSY